MTLNLQLGLSEQAAALSSYPKERKGSQKATITLDSPNLPTAIIPSDDGHRMSSFESNHHFLNMSFRCQFVLPSTKCNIVCGCMTNMPMVHNSNGEKGKNCYCLVANLGSMCIFRTQKRRLITPPANKTEKALNKNREVSVISAATELFHQINYFLIHLLPQPHTIAFINA